MSDPFAIRRQSVFILKGAYRGAGVDGRRDFAIISAALAAGSASSANAEQYVHGEQSPHLRLRDELLRLNRHSTFSSFMPPHMDFMLGDGVLEVLVCSPDLAVREPAWAVNLTLAKAVRAARFHSLESFFWCAGGQLHLVDTRGKHSPLRPSHLEVLDLPAPQPIGEWSSRVRTLPNP